jgi:sigma-B regulation protein RsbU (phosphoserine phosphatase)
MNNDIPKILVVDDEPDLESLIKQKFRRQIKEGKYIFAFAANGVKALEKLNEEKEIELVLTDINMPEMDGLTLLSKIKEMNNPLLHSVIVSAYGDILNIRTAMNGGAFDFIVKPIDLSDLEITIQKAIDNLMILKKALQSRDELVVVKRELEEAKSLQLSMLPKSIPQKGKLDIAVFMKTASEVGGDYYDFSEKSNGSLNVAIGDATGHGMNAGIMVSIMKTLFISDSNEIDLKDFFDTSNRTIKSLNLGRMLMAFAMLNINENRIRFINAAMPPIFVYKSSERKVMEYINQSMPLGAITDFNFSINEFQIEPGDVILLLSDGLPELLNESNEMFGYHEVENILINNYEKSPQEIINALKQRSTDWSGEIDPNDDITFVVIKVK